MVRLLPFLALLVIGCNASAPQSSASSIPAESTAATPVEGKSGDAVPPQQIGDGSAIAFTHWKGLRRATGTVLSSGKTVKVQSFDLDLQADGSMTLVLNDQAENTYKGTWKRASDKAVDLSFVNGSPGKLLFMDSANPYELSAKGKDFSVAIRVQE